MSKIGRVLQVCFWQALVTGGGQGLGGTIALAMARAGADVVLSYSTSADKAMAIGEEIIGMGRRAVAFQADVGDTAQCRDLAHRAEKAYGQIDILISNAGMGQGNGVVNTTDDEWNRTMNVNARATFALTRALLPGMVERKFGAQQLLACSTRMAFSSFAVLLNTPHVTRYS